MSFGKKAVAAVAVIAVLSVASIAVANNKIKIQGSGGGKAKIDCPGGMSRLGHVFSEEMSIFPGDPEIRIEDFYTVAVNFFHVEAIRMGPHAGTHLDAPSHFIDGGRSVDELAAEEFVWPAYKIDVRGMTFTDNFVEIADIEAYEDEHGDIKNGSLVILQTGAEDFFGAEVVNTEQSTILDQDGNPFITADNTDNLFDFVNAGFSFDAVQWLFDERDVDAIGADAYGPDAATDANFDATYATLLNDGVAVVGLANLDSVSVHGDVIMAPTVALEDGSGFSTDPIACHAKKKKND